MGKQSARIYYQGKDHRDIYYGGHYHDAMYLGSQLLWKKIAGGKWVLYNNDTIPETMYKYAYGNGLFVGVFPVYGSTPSDWKINFYVSNDGVTWTLHSFANPFSSNIGNYDIFYQNREFIVVISFSGYANGIIKTTNGESISSYTQFTFTTIDLNDTLTVMTDAYVSCIFQDNNYLYTTITGLSYRPNHTYRGFFTYRSLDGINWESINVFKNTITSSNVTYNTYFANTYPDRNSRVVYRDGYFYYGGYIGIVTSGSVVPTSYKHTFCKSMDFDSALDLAPPYTNIVSISKNCEIVSAGENTSTVKYSLDYENWYDTVAELIGLSEWEGQSIVIYHSNVSTFAGNSNNVVLARCDTEDGNYNIALFCNTDWNILDTQYLEYAVETAPIVYGNNRYLIAMTNGKNVYIREDE